MLEATAIGVTLLLLAIVAGGWVQESGGALADFFTLDAETIVWCLIGYGFLASVLPVWMLLAPRDYLSTFMKIGTIVLLAIGIRDAAGGGERGGIVGLNGEAWCRGRCSRSCSSSSRAARCRASTR